MDKLEKLALSQVLEKEALFKVVFFDSSMLACLSAKEGKSAIWTCNEGLVAMGQVIEWRMETMLAFWLESKGHSGRHFICDEGRARRTHKITFWRMLSPLRRPLTFINSNRTRYTSEPLISADSTIYRCGSEHTCAILYSSHVSVPLRSTTKRIGITFACCNGLQSALCCLAQFRLWHAVLQYLSYNPSVS